MGPPGIGERRGTWRRYTETVGSPSTQNRHGTSAALLTPTRGPVAIFFSAERARVSASGHLTRSGELATHTSAPSSERSMSRAWHSRAGPRASSRLRTAGRVFWGDDPPDHPCFFPGGTHPPDPLGKGCPPPVPPGPPGAPGAGQLLPLDDLAGPQQHRRRAAVGGADQVHAEVHAVGEVDIGVAGRAEHHRVPLGLPPVRMRGGIGRARVRLDLGEPDRDQAGRGLVLEDAAEQIRCDLDGKPGQEVPRDQRHEPAASWRPSRRARGPRSAAPRAARRPAPVPSRRSPCGRPGPRPRSAPSGHRGSGAPTPWPGRRR